MLDVVTIAGSPAAPSRCAAAVDAARSVLERRGLATAAINLRDFPPEALLWANFDDPAVRHASDLVAQAHVVIVATPVYKASYSGVLKTFLDLLPTGALTDKGVLPISTAGSLAHCLVLEYALKPVLSALGAATFLPGVCLLDADFVREGERIRYREELADTRLLRALDAVEQDVLHRRSHAAVAPLLEIAV